MSDWSRVRARKPGTEIILVKTTPAPRKHRLLNVDDAGLTILTVDDPAIPKAVRSVLESTARDHPAYFDDSQNGRTFALVKGVRLGPDGVFQGERKLFDTALVVERVARDDVVEVSVLAKHIGQHAKRGALIGAAIGGTVMGLGAASCSPNSEPGYCNVPFWIALGAAGGGMVGLEYGTIIGIVAPRSPNVIYRR